jgi:cytochrome c-type biogenesis protein CcmE
MSPASTTPERSGIRRRRARIALGACVAAIVGIIVLGLVLSENVVYFRTVSEAVDRRAKEGTDRFRMAGKVVPDSVTQTDRDVRFELSDGKATVEVVHLGDPPALFEPGAPVVCEGRWGSANTFRCDTIMIRHGSEYTPPKVDLDSRDRAK